VLLTVDKVFSAGLCADTEAVDEDDVSDPEYNIMLEDVDDDDDEEIRNDKATRVSSMLLTFTFCFPFLGFLGWMVFPEVLPNGSHMGIA